MPQQILNRTDTAANWTAANPTLAVGEFASESDTLKVKVGDGATAWISLAYLTSGGGGSGTVTSISVTTANGVSGTVATATTTPVISLTLGVITPTSVNSVVLSGSSTPTLAVTGTTTVSGSNTGDQTSVSGNAGTVTGLSIVSGKTLTVDNSVTLAGTDSTTITFPSTSATVARTDAANTFTGHQTIEGVTSTGATGTGKFVFDTSPTLVTPTIGVATATSINKMAVTAPATSSTIAVADGKTLTASNTLTLAGTDSTTMTFPSSSGTVVTLAATQTLTSKTLTTPVLNGTPTGTGVSASPAASVLALFDANSNLTGNNLLESTTSTATAAATTTLTVSSTGIQIFTGSMTQTLKLPVVSALVVGQSFTVINLSTGTITVQSSGANTIGTVATVSATTVTCVSTSGTGAASWQLMPYGGSGGGFSNPMTTIGDTIYGTSGGTAARLPFAQAAASIGTFDSGVYILDSNGIPMNPATSGKYIKIFDECTQDAGSTSGGPLTAWQTTQNGGAVGFNRLSEMYQNAIAPTDIIGLQIVKLSGGTGSGSASLASANFSQFYNSFFNSGIWLQKGRGMLSVTSSVTNQYLMRLGVGYDLSGANEGAYILYDYANSAFFQFITQNGGSATTSTTTFSPVAYTQFDWAIGDDGTNSYLYINGALQATNSTNRIANTEFIKPFCVQMSALSSTYSDLAFGLDFVSFETYKSSRT